MASLTIRNIPEDVKRRFRQIAAAHGRSMEEHMRRLILEAADEDPTILREERPGFSHETERTIPASHDDLWVSELVRLADGAGDGVFEGESQPLRELDL